MVDAVPDRTKSDVPVTHFLVQVRPGERLVKIDSLLQRPLVRVASLVILTLLLGLSSAQVSASISNKSFSWRWAIATFVLAALMIWLQYMIEKAVKVQTDPFYQDTMKAKANRAKKLIGDGKADESILRDIDELSKRGPR